MSNVRTMIQGIWSDVLGNKLKQGFGFLRCGVVDKDGVEVDIVQAEGIQTSPQMLDEFGNYAHVMGDNIFKGAPVMIQVEHHEIHCGDAYEAYSYGTNANGATTTFAAIVPNEGLNETNPGDDQTKKQWHVKVNLEVEAETVMELYEGATLTANGTALSSFNKNRNSSLTDFLEIYVNPTVSDDGTMLYARRVGAGKQTGGQAGRAHELILRDNTIYIVKIINQTTSDNNFEVSLDYYVHPGV